MNEGLLIYNTLLKTAQRGVKVKISQTYRDGGYSETANLATESNGNVQVRSLDFTQWYPGGILHTKSWVVDGKHLYVGSANFDWRSLTQIKELGMAVFDCPCLAEDLTKLLQIHWDMGAPGAKIPASWPVAYATSAYHERPTTVPQSEGDQAVYFSASPPGFQSCGRESDIDAMVKLIDEAQESLDMAVMEYAPCTLYLKPLNLWYARLDEAIRRAAFDRQVKVRFLFSRWAHTSAKYYSYLRSLQDLSSQLPCRYVDHKCTRRGSIQVGLIEVPDLQYGAIPYSRVDHNKYFVTEKAVYIGTSNWTPDYWKYTAGIGMVIRADDISQNSTVVNQIVQIFERDWNSDYVTPLSHFDYNSH
uniref:Phospholipase D domain protein n=1 Tax=Angiostrongylus cantonensis TaxID=6313 RepID=A0A0K0DC18_ANGCA